MSDTDFRIAAIIADEDPTAHQCYRVWYGDGSDCLTLREDTWTEHDVCPSCHAIAGTVPRPEREGLSCAIVKGPR